jgi:SAM-dependent methyltransferase
MNIAQIIFCKLEPILISFYRKLLQSPPPNLEGDRYIEYSWIAAHIPDGPGYALDFGCGFGWMGLLAARRGFKVIAIDLRNIVWPYIHINLNFQRKDLFDIIKKLPPLDLVISCSTIEHVGLSYRYGGKSDEGKSDIEAMRVINNKMNPGGIMLMTIPVGKDSMFYPLHRVYGEKRLTILLENWNIIKKEFWIKNKSNKWFMTNESAALNIQASDHYYGLGLYVLEKPR